MAEAAAVAGMALLLACIFDYRYAMNDDVFIRAIISGKYSGVPSVHNIQFIILLNAFFSLLYRISSAVPWFGIFMVSSQFLSLYGIMICLGKKLNVSPMLRRFLCVLLYMLLTGLMLNELVILQYTYTAALLFTSAALRLYCMEEPEPNRMFWLYFGILMQFLLAFCLRTEIFLFLLPISVLLTLIGYHKKNGFRAEGRRLKHLAVFWGSLLFCVTGLYVADNIGYASRDWHEYRKVFDYRTQLYDFSALPDHERNESFYDAAGISKAQYELLRNYNFSLDDGITGDTLQNVVEYADERRASEYRGAEKLYMQMFTLPLREGLWSYSHRVLFDPKVANDDYPWNYVCAALYLTLLLLTCLTKRWWNIAYLFFLFFVRSGLWMYIILKQRTPARVTHSLFIIEIVCLLVLIFEELSLLNEGEERRNCKWLYAGMAVLSLGGTVAVAVNAWVNFGRIYGDTVTFNEEWGELREYCSGQKENFYFMDVYSMVNYAEEIFAGDNGQIDNYDFCGGWLAKSPLCEEKYNNFGFSSPQEALVEMDNIFFVAAQGTDLQWLTELYEEKGMKVVLEYQDDVAGQFDIIKIKAEEQ